MISVWPSYENCLAPPLSGAVWRGRFVKGPLPPYLKTACILLVFWIMMPACSEPLCQHALLRHMRKRARIGHTSGGRVSAAPVIRGRQPPPALQYMEPNRPAVWTDTHRTQPPPATPPDKEPRRAGERRGAGGGGGGGGAGSFLTERRFKTRRGERAAQDSQPH